MEILADMGGASALYQTMVLNITYFRKFAVLVMMN